MPLNRDAFTRYRLIDERIRRRPSPTLEELIAHLSEHLDRPVSKRTVQLDLQEMRYSQSLKFEAPIVFDRAGKSYSYSDIGYSINNLPVTADDLHGLEFAISLLDQFKELPAIKEFGEAIMKIAETVRFNKQSRGEESIIQFDRPNSYRGIEYIEQVVKAIISEGVADGSFDTGVDPGIATATLFRILSSTNLWFRVGGPVEWAGVTDWYVRLMLNGLQTEARSSGPVTY